MGWYVRKESEASKQLLALPLWAIVALAARSARLYFPWYREFPARYSTANDVSRIQTVETAINLAELAAQTCGQSTQFLDNKDSVDSKMDVSWFTVNWNFSRLTLAFNKGRPVKKIVASGHEGLSL